MATPALDIPFTAPNVLRTMEQTHVCLEITPNDDPRLAYDLAIPREWGYSAEFGPVAHGLFQVHGLGFFTGSMDPHGPVIAVTLTPVPFEVSIDAWARQSITTEGWQIVRAQWFPGPNGLFYDVTAERVINDVAEVRRSSLRNLGSDIITVNCFCARETWEAAKEIFWTAHVTFKLAAARQTRMEVWAEAQAEKSPRFAVAYPLSWSAEEAEGDDPGISGIHLRLTDARGETLLAYVQAKLTQRAPGVEANLERLRASALAQLSRAGVRVTSPLTPLSLDEDPRAIAVKGWLGGFRGAGQLGTSEVQLRVGFIDREGHDAAFVMISPLSTDDPLTALRAQRAFEIARATLTLVPSSGTLTPTGGGATGS
jgi:hypothetical protein